MIQDEQKENDKKKKGNAEMNERLLHTPEGVRDIYNAECEKKMLLEHRLHHRLHLYGFQDIQTPAF